MLSEVSLKLIQHFCRQMYLQEIYKGWMYSTPASVTNILLCPLNKFALERTTMLSSFQMLRLSLVSYFVMSIIILFISRFKSRTKEPMSSVTSGHSHKITMYPL